MATEVKYYRKKGTCIRLIASAAFNYITLPPDSVVALRGEQVFKTVAEMETALEGFEPVPAAEWRSFYTTFCSLVTAERERLLQQQTLNKAS